MPWWWTPVYNEQERGQKLLRQAEPLLKKLGVELAEYFTEEEAEADGVPAHITLGVDAVRMRLMVVYPRWDGRFTEERLAKRVGVELIDAAWASIMHRRWQLKGRKTTFAEYIQLQERLLLAALDRCKPASLVFLQAANIWCGCGKEDEYPLRPQGRGTGEGKELAAGHDDGNCTGDGGCEEIQEDRAAGLQRGDASFASLAAQMPATAESCSGRSCHGM